jgi:hypothetical protein
MMRFIVISLVLSCSLFAKPYQMDCTAKNAPIGKQWLVSATLTGTVNRGRSAATLEKLEGTLSIFHKSTSGKKDLWAETEINQRTLESDSYYHPVKYKNHYRFELNFEKNESYYAEKVDFLLPKLFEAERASRAYFILNHVNDTFGGTIALRCNISE